MDPLARPRSLTELEREPRGLDPGGPRRVALDDPPGGSPRRIRLAAHEREMRSQPAAPAALRLRLERARDALRIEAKPLGVREEPARLDLAERRDEGPVDGRDRIPTRLCVLNIRSS